ncbi:MAG: ABC transporter permease [Chloroflexi bacterium]|nr:MAG: ABC transporter permease [Chloroflexota bacterium]
MAAYLVRRVVGMVVLLFLLSVTVFVLFNLLPGDPARLTCGKACTPQIIEANRHRLGLDQPVLTQYTNFVKGIFFGRTFSEDSPEPIICHAPCLGYSYNRHQQVLAAIADAAPVTFWLAVGAFLIWIVVGISMGILAALNRGSWVDRTIMGISLIGYSMPSFFIGLLLIFFVIIRFNWLPFPSYVSPFDNPIQFLQTMILPWIVLAVLNAAFYMRLTRNQVLEVFGDDYIRTARAKGLPERVVVVKHALRAGLTPIVTAAGLDLAYLLGGAIISENIFNLPGLGSLAVGSVLNSDLPLITGITLVTATIIIFANLVVDLLYAVIDPRVRVG